MDEKQAKKMILKAMEVANEKTTSDLQKFKTQFGDPKDFVDFATTFLAIYNAKFLTEALLELKISGFFKES